LTTIDRMISPQMNLPSLPSPTTSSDHS